MSGVDFGRGMPNVKIWYDYMWLQALLNNSWGRLLVYATMLILLHLRPWLLQIVPSSLLLLLLLLQRLIILLCHLSYWHTPACDINWPLVGSWLSLLLLQSQDTHTGDDVDALAQLSECLLFVLVWFPVECVFHSVVRVSGVAACMPACLHV